MKGAFRLLGLIAAVLLSGATVAAAANSSITAKFSYRGTAPNYSHLHLAIKKDGRTVYSQPVRSRQCFSSCWPAETGRHASSVHVLHLEPGVRPEVLLNLYSGGAHCCWIAQIFSFDPATGSFVKTERNFGDPGYRVKDLAHNGRLEFLSADDSFADAFASFAGSGLPIQILTFAHRRFTDVTRRYRGRIRRDAALWWRAFRHNIGQGNGLIAAWAADEDLLGHRTQVARTLSAQRRQHHLGSPPGWPSGAKFVSALQRFLRRHGYAH